ncbi:MAG: 1-(5-phosphoribosyl)-5-[(5-phosphoribosylamino)methylideneamino]imidazole-4-carboxamide isomerase [Sphingobacteriales bacterium]|nr:MAG: 1-(5-phosphoribosyl)-5-[(5-phosphoribosylamino)methylideneamino]imidazole-4-carboxamide isomerase [Sphingobacteriales bacterium]
MNSNNFIIPAIDIISGKAVRLTQGDYTQQKIYNEDPLEVAKAFEGAGLNRLHLVDLDGAKAGRIQNWIILERIANNTSLQIDFGGGVKSIDDVKSILNAGAKMITIGSLAVRQPILLKEWIENFGTDKFFIGADVYEEKIKINGWLNDGGVDIYTFLQNMIAIGADNFFCTDIKLDGALQGTSVELYKKIITKFPGIQLTASGGVASLEDVMLAKDAGCSGVIIGKAIYEGLINLKDLEKLNHG